MENNIANPRREDLCSKSNLVHLFQLTFLGRWYWWPRESPDPTCHPSIRIRILACKGGSPLDTLWTWSTDENTADLETGKTMLTPIGRNNTILIIHDYLPSWLENRCNPPICSTEATAIPASSNNSLTTNSSYSTPTIRWPNTELKTVGKNRWKFRWRENQARLKYRHRIDSIAIPWSCIHFKSFAFPHKGTKILRSVRSWTISLAKYLESIWWTPSRCHPARPSRHRLLQSSSA